ncbi:MAG: AMP-binding protein [Dehalococcoidia bacterium]|nr:AMP-binding protein [Dehalococcoidia bacterium]
MLGTLRDNFLGTVHKWSDRPAIIYNGQTYSYGELNDRVNQLANYFVEIGVKKGDVIGLLLNNCLEFAIGFLACQKLGAISSCLNYRLSAGSVQYTVTQENQKAFIFNSQFSPTVTEVMAGVNGCRFVCVGGTGLEKAISFSEISNYPTAEPRAVDLRETDICNVIHTSGTTGRPKGAAFTNGTQIITGIQYCLGIGLDRGHTGMSLAPVVVGAATNFFVAYIILGAAQVMIGEYTAEKALGLIARHRVTETFAVPTQMFQMAEIRPSLPDLDISSLRLVVSGGSALSRDLLKRVRSALGCEVLNTYGTTESCTAITYCHTGYDPEHKWESIGKPHYFQEVRVVRVREDDESDPEDVIIPPGEGQLINRGPQSITEYFCTPDEKLRATGGWQLTRDLVRVDSDGYIYPVDRMDNVIISGGENIYPQELEFFLSKHPDIADVAVYGIADTKWGQVVKAIIVRRRPDLTEDDIERYCLETSELARYKRPRVVEFTDFIARNALGKIDRTLFK